MSKFNLQNLYYKSGSFDLDENISFVYDKESGDLLEAYFIAPDYLKSDGIMVPLEFISDSVLDMAKEEAQALSKEYNLDYNNETIVDWMDDGE